MKERLLRWVKRYGVTLWLLMAAGCLSVAGSFAAYTNFNSVKRVVSTGKNNSILFSSNYLYLEDKNKGSDDYRLRQVSTTTTNNTSSFTLKISNYLYDDTAHVNTKDITYTLNISLQPKGGDDPLTGASITIGNTTYETSASIGNQKLAKNTASRNEYTISVPASIKDKANILIETIPDDTSYGATDNQKLAALITMTEPAPVKTWTGQFIDDDNNKQPKDYDGFNYEISGNGTGTVTLTWNSTKLQISPWFKEELGILDDSQSITFSVGGDGQTSAYQTQFYKVGKWDDQTSWGDVKSYVTVEFEEKNTTG